MQLVMMTATTSTTPTQENADKEMEISTIGFQNSN